VTEQRLGQNGDHEEAIWIVGNPEVILPPRVTPRCRSSLKTGFSVTSSVYQAIIIRQFTENPT
jgi:hypothetical protein